MITAWTANREACDALFKGGACAYFVKPIDRDSFVHELKHIKVITE